MKALVAYLAERITSSVVDSLAHSQDGELRRVFHGPCLAVLEPLFELLASNGGIAAKLRDGSGITVPVLLQVERDQLGGPNPPLHSSGRCDPDHPVALRNTPSSLRFVVLLRPGSHTTLSMASASDEFGVGPEANSGNATIDDWLSDGFIRAAREAIAERLGLASGSGRQELFSLFDSAARYADDLEHHSVERTGAWALLARLFEIPHGTTNRLVLASLACGVPPREDGTLRADLQIGVLRRLASQFQEKGIRGTLVELQEGASEQDRSALADCLTSIERRCYLATQFGHAPTSHYRPGSQWDLSEPPSWWSHLTAEAWTALLEDEEESEAGDLVLRCTNSIASNLRSLDGLVLDEVALELVAGAEPAQPTRVTLARTSPGRGIQPTWTLDLASGGTVTDADIPRHRGPLRYQADASGFQKATAKIVSLANWEPGVVIDARTARKASLPKRVRGQSGVYESTLVLEGTGRHYIDAYVSGGVEASEVAECTNAEGERLPDSDARISRDRDNKLGFDVEATGDCAYDFTVTVPSGDVIRIRVAISCEEASPEGCSSEFERLIRLNRQGNDARVSAEIVVDRSRTTVLQGWCLDGETVRSSFRPLVLGDDLGTVWRRPDWSSQQGSILSRGRFLCDPRPAIAEMVAPDRFLECRAKIAARVQGEDAAGLLEVSKLGDWAASDSEFRDLVANYAASYSEWLAQEPSVAPWADILAVCGFERDGQTLTREPDAIIVSPLHPLRLAWHVAAQRAMWEAHCAREPSPAASILDPRCVPDVLHLPLQTTTGSISRVPFFSVDHNSDYWSVLWNAKQLSSIARWSNRAPFDREFGLEIGGVASGFSVSQVCRALDDISEMRAAKPTINVLIVSAAGQTNSCNEGLIEWGRSRLANGELAPTGGAKASCRTGRRRIQILDQRPPAARPDDAKIANLAEDTDGAIRWNAADLATNISPDIGIIAQLESAGDSAEPSELRSPLASGALFRHRVRRQLATGNGAFLLESRSGIAGPTATDPLLASLGEAVERLERMGDPKVAYSFAPSVHSVQTVLDRAAFATVSSSAIDPACFLGGWLGDSYLWDYDLPSYSRRAGDSNGYYLLSRVKDEDYEALSRAIATLPGGKELPPSTTEGILREVAGRGIPTVRGLSSGDHGASGDLGLFVATRLLQDEFRTGGSAGLLRLSESVGGRDIITLVIPVDPFQGYLEDLQKALGLKGTRPDLLVAAFDVGGGPVRCKLTPVEVKYRSERRPMPHEDRLAGLGQARALSELLTKASARGAGGQILWRLTFEHLITTMVGFGLRVYSQKQLGAEASREWARRHEQIVTAILSGELALEIDQRGRLMIIDGSSESRPFDLDEDGFKETIVISPSDACTVVRDEAPAVAAAIKSKVGHWGFLPAARAEQPGSVGGEPQPPQTPDLSPTPAGGVAPPAEGPPLPISPPGAGTVALPVASPIVAPASEVPAHEGIRLTVGVTQGAFRQSERFLDLSDTRLNQLNMGVVGDLGTGKTQLLKSLILQLSQSAAANRGIRPRMLIFDYKKDYTAPDFVEAVGARVVRPNRLPLNLFDVSGLSGQPKPWLQRFRFFADTLSKIYSGIGPVQVQYLKDAVKFAYEGRTDGSAPTLAEVRDAYGELLKGKYDSPFSIIDYLVEADVFDPAPAQGANFSSFLEGVVVLSLGDLGQDDQTKNMIVAVMLNMFYEHMLTIPKRPYIGTDPQLRVVDSYLLVDEADNIMKYEFDVLRNLLLQGREFGVGVILASQYLRHFKTQGTDYREPLLSWFVHKVPNVTPQELGALGLTDDLAALAIEIKGLPVHHCLFKTVGIPGEIVRATPFFELARH